ncbi:TPA: hypothetical protein ACOQZT_000273 [Serratia odorifera]|jgi:hypothetical protein|uniref:Uncharacterized protein n=1 Tax=Serratia odorifera DSM 4582 TaxID=667129 RepID=D4E7S6_SEROD|nr:hypothetical protein HMPREF0758_4226 [Serratia odorifera DSM 4582]
MHREAEPAPGNTQVIVGIGLNNSKKFIAIMIAAVLILVGVNLGVADLIHKILVG